MSEGKSRPHTAAPGEGESVWVVGDSITLRLTSEDTGGAFSLFEGTIPPGGGPPPHVQHRQDGSFYVLDGGFEFLVGEDTVPGSRGARARASTRPVSACTRSRT
jgi:quercetin dioxygenase-like cupin family protein